LSFLTLLWNPKLCYKIDKLTTTSDHHVLKIFFMCGHFKKSFSKWFFTRVARWYSFLPKTPNLVIFRRPWNEKLWYILWQVDSFMAIW
jgi:hypothetical protein